MIDRLGGLDPALGHAHDQFGRRRGGLGGDDRGVAERALAEGDQPVAETRASHRQFADFPACAAADQSRLHGAAGEILAHRDRRVVLGVCRSATPRRLRPALFMTLAEIGSEPANGGPNDSAAGQPFVVALDHARGAV